MPSPPPQGHIVLRIPQTTPRRLRASGVSGWDAGLRDGPHGPPEVGPAAPPTGPGLGCGTDSAAGMSPPRSGPRTPRRPPSGPPPLLRLKGAAVCRPRGQLGGGCSPARPTRHAARAALRGTRVTRPRASRPQPLGAGPCVSQRRRTDSSRLLRRGPGSSPGPRRVPRRSWPACRPRPRLARAPPLPGATAWAASLGAAVVLPAGRSPAGGRRCRQAGRPPRAPTPSLVPPAWESISHARFLRQTPPHPPASGATDAATGLCDRPVHQAVGRRQRARRLLQRFARCRFSETPARGPRPPRTDAGRTCSHSARALGPRRQGPGHELGSGDRHASGPGGGGSKQSRRDVRPSRPGPGPLARWGGAGRGRARRAEPVQGCSSQAGRAPPGDDSADGGDASAQGHTGPGVGGRARDNV